MAEAAEPSGGIDLPQIAAGYDGGNVQRPAPGPPQDLAKRISVGGVPETRFARRFELLGMANLLHLQIQIIEREEAFNKIKDRNDDISEEAFERLMSSLHYYSESQSRYEWQP